MKVDKVLKSLVLIITAVLLIVKLCGWADISWLKVFSVAIAYAVGYALGFFYLLWWNSPKMLERRKKVEEEVISEMLQNSLKQARENINKRNNNE